MAAIFVLVHHRHNIRRNRVFRDRTHPLDMYDDAELYRRFRFSRHTILQIIDDVGEELQRSNRHGTLMPTMQVLIALRFYAKGLFQLDCADLFGVSQATVCRVINRVTKALLAHVPRWVRMPDQREANKQKAKFAAIANMPFVFGCIDGTQILIQAPSVNEHEYVCRKGYHSINVQVICDADMVFIDVVARWPGSVHDARVLRESTLFTAFEGHPKPIEGILLGDSGYMLREWLFTPILHPASEREERYNAAHCSTRNTIERAIGIAKRRWGCLKGLRLQPEKACEVIMVCFMLSNQARSLNLPEPDSDDDLDETESDAETEDNESNPNENAILGASERVRSAAGKAARNRIINRYF